MNDKCQLQHCSHFQLVCNSDLLLYHFILFSGNLKALEDIWILGDWFLKDTFPTLQVLKHGSTVQRKLPPYIYDMYNLFYFFTSPLSFGNNTLFQINNVFIEAINRRDQLPKFIIIVLDHDLIDMINRFDFGITAELERCVKWLAIQMERSLAAKKDQMWNIKPGSVPHDDPKFIWVEMFNRPVTNAAITIHNKFNKGINDLAWQRKHHHIMIIKLAF